MKTVAFRRKREGKTDYKKRLALLKGSKPRVVIRRSQKQVIAQVVAYKPAGDTVLVGTTSKELNKLGWKGALNNLPAGYLTGYLLAKKAAQKKIKDCVLDVGQQTSIKGCSVYAVLKGLVDGGLNIPHSPEVFPQDERIRGTHIAAFAKKLKENKERYERQFAHYVKSGCDPETVPKQFDDVMTKVKGG